MGPGRGREVGLTSSLTWASTLLRLRDGKSYYLQQYGDTGLGVHICKDLLDLKVGGGGLHNRFGSHGHVARKTPPFLDSESN